MQTYIGQGAARLGLVWFPAVLLVGCGVEPLATKGSKSQAFNIIVGQELHVTLQTVGPGSYESPPSVSSPAIRFLSVEQVSPTVPAGPTQQFRFKGEVAGEAIIVFRHSGISRTVTDTIHVWGR